MSVAVYQSNQTLVEMSLELMQSLAGSFWLYFCLTLVTVFVIYRHVSYQLNYWTRLGVAGPRPLPLIGTLYQFFWHPINEVNRRNVKKYGKVYGTYFLFNPQLNIADAELARHILIKDFNKFVNNALMSISDPLFDRMVGICSDDDWRMMRRIVTPGFTVGMLRKMHHLVEECVDDLETFLEKAAENKTEVQLKRVAGCYTIQVIALCAFAARIDAHNEPDNPFVVNILKLMHPKTLSRALFVKALLSLPFINRFIKIPVIDPEITDFFKSATRKIIEQRSEDGNKYHDLLQMMIDATQKKDGIDSNDPMEQEKCHLKQENGTKSNSEFKFGETEVYANAVGFFLTGYAPAQEFFTNFFYTMALYPDVQEKLHQEVKQIIDVNYDSIESLPYLDACVTEACRFLNPLYGNSRIAGQDYQLPGIDIVIKKGQVVNILFDPIHHNPEYHPNPDRFDPTRFLPENKHKIVPGSYIPWSDGPRNCLGMQFSRMEVKAAAVRLIKRFRFVRTANTADPVKFNT